MSEPADRAVAGLQVYIVGGAVRDELLGRPAGDRDWVVVGATPQEMTRRGFIPVGGDFPVFLHPQTKEEYALARTERKSGRGYKGFTFYTGTDVTLEQDLRRRDFTINAMARSPQGELVDPLDGQGDLRARCFRHVGEAFAEDPVRILRLGRFAARFTDFAVAAETLALCRRMVDDGEVDALVPERVWKELSRGLMEAQPARMLQLWEAVGALSRVMPELEQAGQAGTDLDHASPAGAGCRVGAGRDRALRWPAQARALHGAGSGCGGGHQRGRAALGGCAGGGARGGRRRHCQNLRRRAGTYQGCPAPGAAGGVGRLTRRVRPKGGATGWRGGRPVQNPSNRKARRVPGP